MLNVYVYVPTVDMTAPQPGRIHLYGFQAESRQVEPKYECLVVHTEHGDSREAQPLEAASLWLRHQERAVLDGDAVSQQVRLTSFRGARVEGRSGMLAAAAGDTAARYVRSGTALRRLYATGMILNPSDTLTAANGRASAIDLLVAGVDGIEEKLAGILEQLHDTPAPEGILVALPKVNLRLPSDAAGQALAQLRTAGAVIVEVTSLADLLRAWIPDDGWISDAAYSAFTSLRGPAAARGGARPPHRPATAATPPETPAAHPRQSWVRRHLWLEGTLAGLILLSGAVATDLEYLKISPQGIWHHLSCLATACAPATQEPVSEPDPKLDAQCRDVWANPDKGGPAFCAALLRCDQRAGYPLDPQRRAAGLRGGVSLGTLKASPDALAAAKADCKAALELAPDSGRTAYGLYRIARAAGDAQAANDYLQRAAKGGSTMALFVIADDYRVAGKLTEARGLYSQLAGRDDPPPDILVTLAAWEACGIGGPDDIADSKRLIARAVEEAGNYPDAGMFKQSANETKDAIDQVASGAGGSYCTQTRNHVGDSQ